MVGQSLIEAAAVRKQINEFEKLNIAVNAYQLKWDALPGDDPKAAQYFTNIASGNGNGRIEPFSTNYFCQWGTESCMFWGALYQSQLWEFNADKTTAEPTASLQCGTGARYPCFMGRGTIGYVVETSADATGLVSTDRRHHISLVSDSQGGTATWYGGNYIYGYASISPTEARLFDTKIDDSLPLTGIFLARSNHHPQYRSTLATPGGSSTGDSCVSVSAGNPYANATTIDCIMTLETQF